MTEAEKWQSDVEENGTFEYDAPGERTKGTFTARLITGDEIEIKEKRAEGDAIVLVSVDNALYVPSPKSPTHVVSYDPELHQGGTTATGDAGAKMGPSEDATVAADKRKELDEALMQDGVDATEAAEAKAALEGEITQQPTQPLPIEPETGTEPPPPTDLDEEQPEGSGLKEGPPEVMGGATGPLPSDVKTGDEEAGPAEA